VELPAAEALEANAKRRVPDVRPDRIVPQTADLHARHVRVSTSPLPRQGPSSR